MAAKSAISLAQHGYVRPVLGCCRVRTSAAVHLACTPSCRSRTSRRQRCKALPASEQMLLHNALSAHPGAATGFALATIVFLAGMPVLLSGLTPRGVAASWVLGGTIYAAFGAGGFLLVCLYFIFGSAVTKFKLREKEEKGIAEKRSGRRGISSVVGSGFAGIVCACAALLTGRFDVWQAGFVASFCSKLSDTVSSEVGKGFGKTTYLITDLSRVPPGTEGAVSVEGSVAGVAAAVVFGLAATALGQVTTGGALCCAAAASVANLAESYIGATTQDSVEWLTNDVVNVIQICIAAALGVALYVVLQ